MLFELIYISQSSQLQDDEQLLTLLSESRQRNLEYNITGLLLYKDHSFLQLLEGDKASVETIFAKIAKDARHQQVTVLHQGVVASRMFSEWSMGFENLDNSSYDQLPGFSRFMTEQLDIEAITQQHRESRTLLEYFRHSGNASNLH